MPAPFPSAPPPPRPLPAPVLDDPPRLTARTLEGLEWLLARELEAVGAIDLRIGRRTIEFSAPPGAEKETLYRAVLESRTAIRVLEPLGRFRVDSPESLYRALGDIDWTEQLKTSDTLRVDAAIHDTFTTHSLYAAQIVKDAVVDQLRTPSGKRPSVQLRGATLRLALHLVGDVATMFRDAAGRSLHQRGWRMGEVEAPLSEVLAAGILGIAGWWRPGEDAATSGEPVLDPMCGSGTFVIESATIAAGMAPGLWRARRKAHGFFRFRDCDKALCERLVADLEARVIEPAGAFRASDLDPKAVEAARACAEAAGVANSVAIAQHHFEEVRPEGPPGLVVTNPPYGERLALPRAGALFRRLGDWLVQHCGGWRAAVLAPDTPAAGQLGLRPAHRVALLNGPIACRLLEVGIRERSHVEAPGETEGKPVRIHGGSRPIEDQLGDFRRRLAKRFKHLAKWARRQGIEAFRIYDRDIPEIPLVIDWYAGWLHAAEYERPHDRTEIEHDVWLDKMIEAAALELGVPVSQTFLKVRKRQRSGGQYEKVGERQAIVAVHEAGLEFEVNLSDYLDTGLFLDHRQTRALVRGEAEGKRFLNLFCYTGSFSVYAAAGGAAETTSVDLSNTYLEWTRTNLSNNGFKDAGRHRTVRDEARAFLEHRAKRGEPPFDLVVCDPPTFSRSAKSEVPWDVERDHADLLGLVAKNLVPGGVAYFSTNFRRFHLAEEPLTPLFTIREITRQTIPEDFRNDRIHRAWRLVKT
ncbi:MAG: bifunctional 23S rRNA (guanine(2069)-N(7))-methyltransferase RlmK/23S rRNA (guanine(2445)-N(2))-methyltransferase RlmL [Planctomycetia bacterium]|nr:bifunctional 23S rRNA (guanine(2069)-N(7))-methyltransferase RlmK/23S rRNA (guanine(2445)-N(2))-methyltransferase RlmL [Planctomycetia bacterium]